MEITELTISNFLGIKAVNITPEGKVVTLSGANGAGKSSVMEAIAAVLGADVPEMPIKIGESKSTITVVLDGKYKITRTMTKTGSETFSTRIQIEDGDGEPVKSPQTFLNELLGKLTFDPFKFSTMKDKERREVLVELTGLDLSEVEAKIKADYDERTDVGRVKKKYEGAAEALRPTNPDEIPDEAIDVAKLSDEKDILVDRLRDYGGAQTKLKETMDKRLYVEGQIENLKADLSELERQETELLEIVTSGESEIETKRERLKKINDEIETSTKTNESVAKKKEWFKAVELAGDNQKDYDILTAKLAQLDMDKKTAIKAVEMPVKGLSFSDDGVRLDGVPFSQVNKSLRIRASMEIAIAMNPKIRVVLIEDGSLMDDESMAIVLEMVKKHDFQLWIEVVDSSGTVGIFIEDGEIKAA